MLGQGRGRWVVAQILILIQLFFCTNLQFKAWCKIYDYQAVYLAGSLGQLFLIACAANASINSLYPSVFSSSSWLILSFTLLDCDF